MKSVKYIKALTLSAMVVIILLQGVWMRHSYQLTEQQLYLKINEMLNVSINKELMLRKDFVVDSTTNEIIGISEDDYETGTFLGPELFLQEFLTKKNFPILIDAIDSIFHSEIAQHNIHGTFIINRINTVTDKVLETTDSLHKGTLNGALASQVIPIRMDGSEGVQVLLISPYRTVLRQMIFVLALSLLLLLFVGYAVFFLLRSFITEKRLRQFQTDFSHALVHNMATPLGTIAQINNLMTHDKLVADVEKRNTSVAIARQQILNLQALTDRILTIARSEQSGLVPKLDKVHITKEIENIVATFSLQSKKKVCFSTCFQPQDTTFHADKMMLINAIENLIENAIKYSGDSVQIDIKCRLPEDGLLISVKDNGYGISKKDQRLIFTKFERGEAIKRGEATGFGLGLAYVRSVAKAHGGTVNLYSEKGEGTTFELFIPHPDKITSFPIITTKR